MSRIKTIELKLSKQIFALMCFVFAFVATETKAQQQSQFTNILLNQYLYNPAFAGTFKGMQFNAGSRLQWTGFDGAPRTYMASGYGTLKKHANMAVGGMVLNDQMGLLNRTSIYGSYSYHLKLNDHWKMGFGMSLGFVQYNVKVYNANPYDKDDNFLASSILNANAFDANGGFLLYHKKFFFGLSGQQLPSGKIRWDNTIGRLTPHVYIYSGFNQVLDKKKKEYVLQPSILMRFNSPNPFEIEYNVKCTYKSMLWAGISFRHAKTVSSIAKQWQNNSLCAMLGVTVSKQFTLGYSFDVAMNNLRKYNNGSHEVILSYTLLSKKGVVKDKVQAADEDELNTIDNSMKTNIKSQKKK
ncbi:MAG: type IX secretion system membrane protein PorP/SprF [Sphingobacteriaceae bacterium]|nr:type IX secretion system membrane protein PorP/SprF [Sphingobacteriaceae bacterium]